MWKVMTLPQTKEIFFSNVHVSYPNAVLLGYLKVGKIQKDDSALKKVALTLKPSNLTLSH